MDGTVCYSPRMTNRDYNFDFSDHIPYDETFDSDEFVAELMEEGYTQEEAERMAGEYDPDAYFDQDDDIPEIEDFPDFDSGEDLE